MDKGYSTLTVSLHWLLALLVLFQYASIQYLQSLERGDPSLGLGYMLHKSVGITILTLTLFRVILRVKEGFEPLPVHMAGWEKLLARGTHFGFYALLLLIPLSGWAFAVTPDRPLAVFGVIPVPDLGIGMREFWHNMHEWLQWGLLGLFGLHVLGALKHYFIDRDGVPARMIPFLRRPQ
ncbi:MAG: cytochrome b [Pacificimonas sp.]|jgi:cytochrome b561|nr:cytochrome b [Pacificimonas sp.]